jgi:hypothetical protein
VCLLCPPRVVLEVGYSESMVRLRRDAELWLKCGEGSVRTVILIKAEPARNDRGIINHSNDLLVRSGVMVVLRELSDDELDIRALQNRNSRSVRSSVKDKSGFRLVISWKKESTIVITLTLC